LNPIFSLLLWSMLYPLLNTLLRTLLGYWLTIMLANILSLWLCMIYGTMLNPIQWLKQKFYLSPSLIPGMHSGYAQGSYLLYNCG
ncbi:MAG: hypothetical protein ABIK19_04780, partial [candidate division WOR-3 bacterium]